VPEAPGYKPLVWWADTKRVLLTFPEDVQDDIGHGLSQVQAGEMPPRFAPLTHISHGVYEVKVDEAGEAYRTLYVARYREAVYAFLSVHKKSKRGKGLLREVEETARQRLRDIQQYRREQGFE
jgi:phage-related protein